MTETFCDSGQVKRKAGAFASSTITNDPVAMTEFINEVENDINIAAGLDLVTGYSGYNSEFKLLLQRCCSTGAAVNVINYDMSEFGTLFEAQTALDVNWAIYKDTLKEIKNKDKSSLVTGN